VVWAVRHLRLGGRATHAPRLVPSSWGGVQCPGMSCRRLASSLACLVWLCFHCSKDCFTARVGLLYSKGAHSHGFGKCPVLYIRSLATCKVCKAQSRVEQAYIITHC